MTKTLLLTLILLLLNTTNIQATNDSMRSENVKRLLKEAKSTTKPITPKQFFSLIDEDEEEFIQLDIREDNQQGHGEIYSDNNIKLTRGYIEYKIGYMIRNKNAKIVVVCCSGSRALFAAKTLKDLGYTNVYYLEGGVKGWLDDGYPLDTVFGELYFRK